MSDEDENIGTQVFRYEDQDDRQTQRLEINENEGQMPEQVGELCIEKQKYPVYKGVNLIGRHPECDICINNKTVSSQHAEIEASSKTVVFISDVNSSNGTRLKNMLLRKHRSYEVTHGSTIQFGEVMAIYRIWPNKEDTKENLQKQLINTSSPNKSAMNVTQVNSPDVSRISCSQSLAKIDSNNSEANIYDQETQCFNASSDVKSTTICTTHDGSNDMFDDNSAEMNGSGENNKDKQCESIVDESIYEANTQKFEKSHTVVSESEFEASVSRATNKKEMNTSDKMSLLCSTPKKNGHQFLVPETPKFTNVKRRTYIVKTSDSESDEEGTFDTKTTEEISRKNISEQQEKVRNLSRSELVNDTNLSIFDAPTQQFVNDIYDAPTQKVVPTIELIKSKIIEEDSDTDEEGLFEAKKVDDNNPVDIHDVVTQQLFPKDKNTSTSNNTSNNIVFDENSNSNDSTNILETEEARELLNVDETQSIFDAETQKVVSTVPKNTSEKTAPEISQNSDSDETDEENAFEDIYNAETQKVVNPSCEAATKPNGNIEDSSSNDSIDLLATENAAEYLQALNHSNSQDDQPKNLPKLVSTEIMLDAPVQTSKIAERSLQVNNENEVMNNSAVDIHEIATQKLPKQNSSIESGQSKSVDENSNSETDEEGNFADVSVRISAPEDDIYNVATQKLDESKRASVIVVEDSDDESVNLLEEDIFDIPTQKIGTNENSTKHQEPVSATNQLNELNKDNDSETDEEGDFRTEENIHEAMTQKIDREAKKDSDQIEVASKKKINFSLVNVEDDNSRDIFMDEESNENSNDAQKNNDDSVVELDVHEVATQRLNRDKVTEITISENEEKELSNKENSLRRHVDESKSSDSKRDFHGFNSPDSRNTERNESLSFIENKLRGLVGEEETVENAENAMPLMTQELVDVLQSQVATTSKYNSEDDSKTNATSPRVSKRLKKASVLVDPKYFVTVNLRTRRKRKILDVSETTEKESNTAVKRTKMNEKEGGNSEDDSQNYYANLRSTRKNNILRDSQDSVEKLKSTQKTSKTEKANKTSEPRKRTPGKNVRRSQTKLSTEQPTTLATSPIVTRSRSHVSQANKKSLKNSLSREKSMRYPSDVSDSESDQGENTIDTSSNINTRSRSRSRNREARKRIHVTFIKNNSEENVAGPSKESQEVETILNNPPMTAKRRKSTRDVKDVSASSDSGPKITKILFTGVDVEVWQSSMSKLGIREAKTMASCQVLLTDKIRRTVKFMCILALGKPILTVDWLKDSAKAGYCLDWTNYILKDTEYEKERGFSLKESIEKARESKIFNGYSFFITPEIKLPPIPELKEMIKSAGGSSHTVIPRKWPEMAVIISSKPDLQNAKKYVAKAPKGVTVHTTEFILHAILHQKIDFEHYSLKIK